MPEEPNLMDVKKLRAAIAEALLSLSEPEALVLKLRFGLEDGLELSAKDVAHRLRLSVRRVGELEHTALRKLSHPARSRKIVKLESRITPIIELESRLAPENKPLTGLIEFPVDSGLLLITKDISKNLAEYFARHPEELKTMDRRSFEEMIAGLFDGFGYTVELTKQTRDGGRDIIAVKDSEVAVKYIIEAKRPDPGNPVAVQSVRELFGVKGHERATKAILATTTYFTRDARLFSEDVRWELELRDYEGIIRWLEDYQKIKRGE